MTTNQSIILAIIIVYLLANILIGLIYGKIRDSRVNTTPENKFFLGGRRMNGFILAMTTMATYTSVSSFISGPGAAGMTYGYAQAWIAAVQIPVTFLVLGVIGNKMALFSRETGEVTISGYLKVRYKSDALVIITSLLMVAFFISQMTAQFTGGATLIQSITGLDYKLSLFIFAVVVVIYTSLGGFTAVVITDTIQGIIMCFGTFLLIIFVLSKGGGLVGIDAGLSSNLPGVYDNLTAVYTPGSLLSFWILVGFGTLGLPQTAVRGMGFKTTKDLRQAMVIGAIVCAIVIVGMHLAGVWAGALVDADNLPTSDYFIPSIAQEIMPVGVAGIFLAAPMAAVMSTVSSLLILASATVVKDLIKNYIVREDVNKLESYDRNISKISPAITFIIGIITMVISMNPPDIIFFLNLFALGGLECSFLWPLIGGLFYKKGTKKAAIASSIGAVATYIFCYYKVSVAGINAVVWGLLAGGIIYFVISNVTYAEQEN